MMEVELENNEGAIPHVIREWMHPVSESLTSKVFPEKWETSIIQTTHKSSFMRL